MCGVLGSTTPTTEGTEPIGTCHTPGADSHQDSFAPSRLNAPKDAIEEKFHGTLAMNEGRAYESTRGSQPPVGPRQAVPRRFAVK